MEYRLLGPVEAIRDGAPVELTARQRALLALLLVHADEVVASDRIIEELWRPSPDKDRQNALWVIVSRLRALLEPDREKRTDGSIVLTRPPGYLLATEPGQLDVHRFAALEAEARALIDTDPAAASQRYGEALALWRGRALEEFTYDDWAIAEISRLEELRLAALEGRVDADLRCGRAEALVGELESLVRLHPLRERLVRLRMLALYRAGRQGDALRVFADLRVRLAESVGLDPAAETIRLEELILLDDPSLRLAVPGPPGPAASVRGYELREPIASGPAGTMYRAFQPVVGREVAMTIVERGLANEPEFIRRFEHESRTVATLDHLRIVPVFDFWREPDAAFLVTRHFPRGTLADLIDAGAVPPEQARVVIEHIAAALDAAHRHGLVHGGVGPDHVMIDDDGNGYLTGFGIHAIAGDGAASLGEPGEIDRIGQAADLAALDALAGFLGTERSTVAPRPPPQPLATEVRNPYLGLRAFDEADQESFFGRDRLVERLIIRLGDGGPRGRFVVLAGPSGSGKSSVVRAGLTPALRRGAIADSEHWFLVTMTPGDRPFDALAEAMRRLAVGPPGDLAEHLATFGIAETAERCSPDPTAQTLIVIDQFEELFTRATPSEATAFMDALAAAVADRHSGVKVVATLRADFLDRPLRHAGVGPLLPLGTEMVTPMGPAELEAAIVGPARALDVGFEPGLVAMIAADVAHQAAALPLLQHTLTELFERRVGHSLTIEAYRELGGVSAALARRADLIHDRLSPEDQAVARDVFLRLVTVTDGAADTRRRVPVRELAGAGPNVGAVLDAFGHHRLLTNDCDPISREPTVEVAHEALLAEWGRLAGWIDDARDHLHARRRLAAATDEWVAHDEHPDDLLAAAPLDRFRSWIDDPPLRLDESERRFLVASAAASSAEAEAEQRRIRRLRRLVLASSSALVLALVAGSLAFSQQRRADRAAQQADEAAADAEVAALLSRSAATIDDDPELALLLALEARRQMPGPDADRATLQALGASPVASRVVVRDLLIDDCFPFSGITDQTHGSVEFATVDGRMLRRDTLTGEVTDNGPPPAPCVLGTRDATSGGAISIDLRTIWRGAEWEGSFTFDTPTFPVYSTADLFVTTSDTVDGVGPGTLDFRDLETAQPFATHELAGNQLAWDLSADETLLAGSIWTPDAPSGESRLVVFDTATGALVNDIAFEGAVGGLRFDRSTGLVWLAFFGGRIATVDPDTGTIVEAFDTDAFGEVFDIGLRPDGQIVVVERSAIVVIDPTTGAADRVVDLDRLADAWVREDGLVVIRSTGTDLEVYDTAASAFVERSWVIDADAHTSVHDGWAAALDTTTDVVEIIELATGDRSVVELTTPSGERFEARVAYADAAGLWVVSARHTIARFVDDELRTETYMGSTVDVGEVPLLSSQTGTRVSDRYAVVGAGPDGMRETSLLELDGDDARLVFSVSTPDATAVVPTIDGGVAVVALDGTLRVFGPDGAIVSTIDTGAPDAYVVALDPTGRRLAIASDEDIAAIVELATGSTTLVARTGSASNLGFGPDGDLLAITQLDGTVRLWDNGIGAFVATVASATRRTPDGEPGWYDEATASLWTTTGDRLIEIPLDPEVWVIRACELVGRELTPEEWEQYVPGDGPQRPVCG